MSGYTHRWTSPGITRQVWDRLVEDVRTIISHSGVEICSPIGITTPILNLQIIGLNGSAERREMADSFYLVRAGGGGFCHTEREPYDEVVGAILIRAATIVPEFTFTSDGNVYGQDWQPARDLFNRCFAPRLAVLGSLGRSGGLELTNEVIALTAAQAEAGYELGQLRSRHVLTIHPRPKMDTPNLCGGTCSCGWIAQAGPAVEVARSWDQHRRDKADGHAG